MTKPRRIKVGIIVDHMGSSMQTPEEEVEEHKRKVTGWLSPDVPEFHEPHYPAEGEGGIKPGTELLLYDFGGLAPGASGLQDGHTRDLLQWAEEHPNGLVLIVSAFTFRNFIEPEMQVQGLTLPNIVCDQDWDNPCPIPEWWLGHPPGQPEDDEKPHGNLNSPSSRRIR